MEDTQSVSREELPICVCGGREYKARDAIDAAIFRGELSADWREFIRRVAAENQAEELELELDENAIDSAVEAFRYQHDLITAEEMERWLSVRGLNLDDFGEYFARQHWVRTVGDHIAADTSDITSADPEMREVFTGELILSDKLDLLIKELMWRLAAVAANSGENPGADRLAAERQAFVDRAKIKPAELTEWLNRLGRDESWFQEMVSMEAVYRRRLEGVIDPQARKRELALMRMPLTRFEAEIIELESLGAAKEALLCIREDEMSMEEIAAEGRYPYRRATFVREDLPADVQAKFLSVSSGDILDPVQRGDGFELYRITDKIEPHADDPAVQKRIDQRLTERHFDELASKYVEPRLASVISQE